jgi:uncharacterized protein (UPF0548 family)
MICLGRPSAEAVASFLERQRGQPFTYPDPGATRNEGTLSGFVVDHNRRQVGSGQAAFAAACAAVRRWEMYNIGWVEICQSQPPIGIGTIAAILARFGGVWWPLGYPMARRLQKRFAVDSLAAMERAVRERT